MIDTQSSALAHRSLWRRRVAVQFWGCLAPSARHLCSTGPGIASSSVRCGIFRNGRKMSLLTELVSHLARNSTYMPALTGLRISGMSGQIKPSGQNQTKIKPIQTKKMATPCKVKQGFFPQKNSQFFYPPILQNTGRILKKRAKKPRKFAPKNMQFLNESRKPHFQPGSQGFWLNMCLKIFPIRIALFRPSCNFYVPFASNRQSIFIGLAGKRKKHLKI